MPVSIDAATAAAATTTTAVVVVATSRVPRGRSVIMIRDIA